MCSQQQQKKKIRKTVLKGREERRNKPTAKWERALHGKKKRKKKPFD